MFLNSLLLLYTIIVNISRRKRKKEKITIRLHFVYSVPMREERNDFSHYLLTNNFLFATINLTENKARFSYGKQV